MVQHVVSLIAVPPNATKNTLFKHDSVGFDRIDQFLEDSDVMVEYREVQTKAPMNHCQKYSHPSVREIQGVVCV